MWRRENKYTTVFFKRQQSFKKKEQQHPSLEKSLEFDLSRMYLEKKSLSLPTRSETFNPSWDEKKSVQSIFLMKHLTFFFHSDKLLLFFPAFLIRSISWFWFNSSDSDIHNHQILNGRLKHKKGVRWDRLSPSFELI